MKKNHEDTTRNTITVRYIKSLTPIIKYKDNESDEVFRHCVSCYRSCLVTSRLPKIRSEFTAVKEFILCFLYATKDYDILR